ncbi:MAG: ComF family protein [Deltaproteobacteria bacterium]|nr:ComF family protein [Deltaproteobacteria bacterium]
MLQPRIYLISFGIYQGFWRQQLVKAKFKQDIFAYLILEKALTATLDTYQNVLHVDHLISIPTHPVRTFVRGGNIISHFEHKIATRLRTPTLHDILKKRFIRRQSKLEGKLARQKNIKHAFRVTESIAGTNLLLFDDVCTTGATLKAAIKALQQQKPQSITCITLLRSALEVSSTFR